MKELSIEEKAKAYDNALKVANKYKDTHIMFSSIKDEIFPELAESEDKKIKSVILKALMTDEAINILVECGIYYEDVESWLKKQREQKHTPKHKIGDTIYYNSFGEVKSMVVSDVVIDGTDSPMYEDKEGNVVFEYELIEQKPTEWSKEDEKMWKDVLSIVEGSVHPLFYDKVVNWLKSLKYRVLPQPKQEWSEEDSMMIDNILGTYETLEAMLDLTTSQDRDILENMKFERGWIKRLKNRVQPKQWWNEDDKQYLEDTLRLLDGCPPKVYNYYKVKNWLNSIKDRVGNFNDGYKVGFSSAKYNQWKPSEEQIEALDEITNNHNLPVTQTQYNKLINLQDDLKKLREEWL